MPDLLPLILAPFAGSFLGVLIRRLPEGRPVVAARSGCERCGHRLDPRDLVPLLSYAALRGRCRACRAPIGAFHPAVELAALGVAIWALLSDPAQPAATLWATCLLGWCLLALGWIDWQHGRLPDALTLPLLLGGLVSTALLEPWHLTDHALGAAIGYATFRLVGALYRTLRGRDGLGQGDAKLLAACGAWVGWEGLPPAVLLAALAGITLTLARAAKGGAALSGATSVPFGPCLALGAWVARLHAGLLDA